MSVRGCRSCGTPEVRTADAHGRETTNLCPLTDECVDCLAKNTPARKAAAAAVVRKPRWRVNLVKPQPKRSDELTGRDLAIPTGDRD